MESAGTDVERLWLILTTAHAEQDGRLQRHAALIRDAGASAVISAHEGLSRARRLLLAPVVTWRCLRKYRPSVVLFPDPELWWAGPSIARLLGVRAVVDIHEDYASVSKTRAWIPSALRGVSRIFVRSLQWIGRKTAHVSMVAANELASDRDVVLLNLPVWKERLGEYRSGTKRLVYVGDVSEDRGLWEMIRLVSGLPGFSLDIVGPCPAPLRESALLKIAEEGMQGRVRLHGRLPYSESWKLASDAGIGLSLLKPTEAYRVATPTKLWEYMALGLPVLASDLPPAVDLIGESGAGICVDGLEERVSAVHSLLENGEAFSSRGLRFMAQRTQDGAEAFRELASRLQF